MDLALLGRRNVQEIELVVEYTTRVLAGPQLASLNTFWLKQGSIWRAVWLSDEYRAYRAGTRHLTPAGPPLYERTPAGRRPAVLRIGPDRIAGIERNSMPVRSMKTKGGSHRMRKYPLRAAAAAMLVGVMVVGLASASHTAAIPSWLPSGVTPAGANWASGEGDESNSRFSTLGQINSTNVQNLHVVWNQQFNTPDIQFSPEGQPMCCPNNLLYQAYIQGVAAMAPDTARLPGTTPGRRARSSRSSGSGSGSTTPETSRTTRRSILFTLASRTARSSR